MQLGSSSCSRHAAAHGYPRVLLCCSPYHLLTTRIITHMHEGAFVVLEPVFDRVALVVFLRPCLTPLFPVPWLCAYSFCAPPLLLRVTSKTDVSNFDKVFTSEKAKITPPDGGDPASAAVRVLSVRPLP